MSEFNMNIRLVPTLVLSEMPVDPVHHTERGIFNLVSYLVPIVHEGAVYDAESGEMVDSTDVQMYAVYVYIFWMGIPVQKHLLVITDENSRNFDAYDLDEAIQHSQMVHNHFGMYIEGKANMFPSFRAFGWAFVLYSDIVAIQMWEQSAVAKGIALGNSDMESMIDWADHLDMLNDDLEEENQRLMLGEDDDAQFGDITFVTDFGGKEENIIIISGESLDIPIDMGVNLNSNVRAFLDKLEKGQDDDETDGVT